MFNSETDIPLEYKIPYKKNNFILSRTNPFGHWVITLERGFIPKELRGQFTSRLNAEKAVELFLNKKG